MSIGTHLLQEWLDLRSSTRRHRAFWDEQRRHRLIANMVKGDEQVHTKNGTHRMGLMESTPGLGTRVSLPFDLLSKSERRAAQRLLDVDANVELTFQKDHPNPHYPEVMEKAPALVAADQVLGGHLLGAGPSTEDIKMLGDAADQAAAVAANCTLYFWGTDPLRAAMEASTSLPEDSAILADLYTELPRRGLWIFETPIEEQTTDQDSVVHALLWDLSEKGLWMMALVRVDRTNGRGIDRVGELAPTWSGWFPSKFPDSHPRGGERLTLKDLEQSVREMYRASYDPSDPNPTGLLGEDRTVATNMKFSKFWLAAAQWMRQRVLVRKRPDRVLPKNKKRARKMAEQVKGQMPTIEMIQLRRTEGSVTQHTGTPRHYRIRFVVHGFWRNQWYASRGVHAPKWIASYVKGPKDAPLKETIRGFAVTR